MCYLTDENDYVYQLDDDGNMLYIIDEDDQPVHYKQFLKIPTIFEIQYETANN
jgi:hypothetical protein